MANGDASGAYLNRKSHGASYKPPVDVQVIILSDYSPYEIYGKWESKLQRRVISEDVLSTITDRFYIERLDGEDAREKRKCMDPTTWTTEEFKAEITELIPKKIDIVSDEEVDSTAFLEQVVILIKRRYDNRACMTQLKAVVNEKYHRMAEKLFSNRLNRLKQDQLADLPVDLNRLVKDVMRLRRRRHISVDDEERMVKRIRTCLSSHHQAKYYRFETIKIDSFKTLGNSMRENEAFWQDLVQWLENYDVNVDTPDYASAAHATICRNKGLCPTFHLYDMESFMDHVWEYLQATAIPDRKFETRVNATVTTASENADEFRRLINIYE